jgi:SAM-dependent methyltransferase
VEGLDDPGRISEIRRKIETKPSLKRFYEDVYRKYAECLKRCPEQGLALELGSGAGFAKKIVPELITSDILPYDGVERIIDGARLPFPDQSLRLICMVNVFHHIPNVESFLREVQRCLVPYGRLFIVDQHLGYISTPILKYIHHEPFSPDVSDWKFESSGPLSDANGALTWVVFVRDIARFEQLFPQLRLVQYRPHTPLGYWMTGGLKRWNLVPDWAIGLSRIIDRSLIRLSPKFGSFVDVEVVKDV